MSSATPAGAVTITPAPTATDTPVAVPCVGDCNGGGKVTIAEIVTLVKIALGNAGPLACPSGIPSGAAVDIALALGAVNNALNGCGGG
jgi:hypothetical protein